MNRLVEIIGSGIRESVQKAIRSSGGAELRRVFHGPPQEILLKVFELFRDGGGIEAERPSGERVVVPVVRQVDRLPPGKVNPALNASGDCDSNHLMTLRNSPAVPRFVALLAPGSHAMLSLASAVGEFGVSASANSGTATIDDWISDPYIAALITQAVERVAVAGVNAADARVVVEAALKAADEVDRHDVQRRAAWAVLARVFEIPDGATDAGNLLSLACGVPPREDGTVGAKSQLDVLGELASEFEEQGFQGAITELSEDAPALDRSALSAFIDELTRRCDLPTAFSRAESAHYGPAQGWTLGSPPDWWRHLTVERWNDLLREDRQEAGSCLLECTNSLVPHARGVNAIVVERVDLEAKLPEHVSAPVTLVIGRETGVKSGKASWERATQLDAAVTDDSPPSHKGVIRYSAEASGFKKTSIKVISLASYEPRLFVDARTASKVTLPKIVGKKSAGSYETSLLLEGNGRHYLDIFVAPGVNLAPESCCFDAENRKVEERTASLRRVSDHQYGLEVEATGECSYVLDVQLPSGDAHQVRVNLSCDEVSPESCSSEFERLIKLNCQPAGRATTDVQVDRTSRAADLQAWALDDSNVERSFYPLVVAPDLDKKWHRADWLSAQALIFSRGKFLSDPRPTLDEMQPPPAFISSRREIAEMIRGKDGHGLVESATLGEWAATEPEFATAVEEYVRAYAQWLDSDAHSAAWSDVVAVTALEQDGETLALEPDAILLSPLHPLRLGWHVAAQRALWLAHSRRAMCPAASILDPRCVPDVLLLPLRTATGMVARKAFFAVDSSSDYWSILWNADRLDSLPRWADKPPFNRVFGVQVGGISSGFSVAQVGRALDDVSEMLAAKPTLNVVISSAAGQTNACNDGLLEWGRVRLGTDADGNRGSRDESRVGPRCVQIIDERAPAARPDDAEISNLAEDTENAVRWLDGGKAAKGITPDLGIIAQLESANGAGAHSHVRSPVSAGALIRHRVRQQLNAGNGAFLCESRTGGQRPESGDVLLDALAEAVLRAENLSEGRIGYSFAPSVSAVQNVLGRATFAAVSSAAVDPACFLGGWLKNSYLWDYELPSYSHRAGDSNGYYLLSQVKEVDVDALKAALGKLPGCESPENERLEGILREVASRGIPTVRGLSSGDHGASGDLGLFIASRLLQDEFRNQAARGLLRVAEEVDGRKYINLALPVDPFRGYLEDLGNALKLDRNRPDLLVASFDVTDARVSCKLTPVEVKYRGTGAMSAASRSDALRQARALTELFKALRAKAADPDALIWSLAYQHLLVTMVGFGLRVYSQQTLTGDSGRDWAALHEKIIGSILSSELDIELDERGRLIVIDATKVSSSVDDDGDGFKETMLVSLKDAATVVLDSDTSLHDGIKASLGRWDLLARKVELAPNVEASGSPDAPAPAPAAIHVATTLVPVAASSDANAPPATEPSGLVAEPALAPAAVPVASAGETSDDSDAAGHPTEHSPSGSPSAVAPRSPGVRIHVGYTSGSFKPEERVLKLSETELNQLNIGVVGDLGTGKTQFLKSLIYQTSISAAANRGIRPRFLIFDYKKDYASPDFVKAVNAKVVKPFDLPLNIFDTRESSEPNAWMQRFRFFSDTLSKIFSGIGPVQQQKLKSAVKKAYEDAAASGRQPTLVDVHAQYAEIVGANPDSPFSIIDDLVDMKVFTEKPPPGATFQSFFDGVVVVSLGELGQDDRTKNMLVALLLNMFYEHMLTIPKRPYEGNPQMRALDSFLLVDEADNIMKYEFDVLRKLLLQGREFGVGIVLASQYLRHFKVGATDYREPLLSWFVHKVPNVTAQEIGALGLTEDLPELADKVKALPNHHCLFKTVGVDGEIVKVTPFHELVKKM